MSVPVNPRLAVSAFKQFEKLLLILIFSFPKCSWKICLEKCGIHCFKIWFYLVVREGMKGKVWVCILEVWGLFWEDGPTFSLSLTLGLENIQEKLQFQ